MTERTVAYICARYPELSQTFVTSEVDHVRRYGWSPEVHTLFDPFSPGAAPEGVVVRPLGGDVAARRVRPLLAAAVRFPRGFVRAARYLRTAPLGARRRRLTEAATVALSYRHRRPDWIHAHFASEAATVAMLASWLLDVPYSFTAHAIDIFCQDHDVATKTADADVVVTVCRYNADYIAERWSAPERMAIVECGVDADEFVRTSPLSTEPFHVVAVGRLVEKKGFDLLVDAAGRLRDRGIDITVTIVGDGPELERLTALVDDADLHDVVHLAGRRRHDEIRAVLESATVFCLPCRVAESGDRDSQPVVIKEAMAMEIPIVATREVAIPEMVDERCGVLVTPDDPYELADALARLAADRDALSAMGSAGRARVLADFDLRRTVPKLVAAWESAR